MKILGLEKELRGGPIPDEPLKAEVRDVREMDERIRLSRAKDLRSNT